MSHSLSITKAARLVGVPRGELQARIRRGELESFDGMVSEDDLQLLYPDLCIDADRALERVNHIKQEAYSRRVMDRVLPDKEVLGERVNELGKDLVRLRQENSRYELLFESLKGRLREMAEEGGAELADHARELREWLVAELADKGGGDSPHPLQVRMSRLSLLSPQVRLLPSNHEFLVEGADTILEAALHAGLSLSYGCSNGNCGKCKARVVSGEVRRVRHHDYRIGEAEKLQGYTLLCSYAPVTDLVVEASVARSSAEVPLQLIKGRVQGIERLHPEVALVRLQTPRMQRLRFLGGQSVRLTTSTGLQHELPLASCPCDDRNLQFHVPRGRKESFCGYVFEGLRVGETVTLEGPYGDFVVADEVERPPVFIAGDTGFAAVRSLIEHVVALDISSRIDLLWLASRPDGHYLGNLCTAWKDALDDFHYHPVFVDGGASAWSDALRKALADLPERSSHDYWVAGPAPLLAAASSLLGDVPDGQVHLLPVG